ncbi:MAG: acyl-CoA dehydrogenase family protein [Pseudomonadota bacterium]
MDFTFTQDQLMFQEEVHKFLVNEITPQKHREQWDSETGRNSETWVQLAELGLAGMTVPEEFGGLGLTIVDFILLAQECGYVALPESLVHNVMVAVPFLLKLNNEEINKEWLPKIVQGEAVVIVALEGQEFIEDLHVADLLFIERNGEFFMVNSKELELRFNESVDPSRRLFAFDFDKDNAEVVAKKDTAKCLSELAFYSGALGVAAQALGLTQRMLDLTVDYTANRTQFGKPIGSFQAVKHRMANVACKLEYAKAPVYRAAYALCYGDARSPLYVAHAKLSACEAADLAAKNCIQAHGAMGYTWEMDLHIFMKKAWAFNSAWGDMAYMKNRVSDFVFADEPKNGAGNTFI